MTGRKALDEKMQPKLKSSHRTWQFFNRGDYYYGQCPRCGNNCQPDFEQPTEEEHVRVEFAECEECGCKFKVETTTAYRFGGLDED